MRTVQLSTVIASTTTAFGLSLLIASAGTHLLELIGSLTVIVSAMYVCADRVLHAVEANHAAIDRKSHDDDASFDAGFEAGHLKGYAEGRRTDRLNVVPMFPERRVADL